MDQPSYTTQPYVPWPFLGPPQGPDEIGRLAQYRVLKPLGQGGMGIVFQAEDEQLRRPAALKVMRPDYAAHDDARARFLREARAAAKPKPDHIATIYQGGEHHRLPFQGHTMYAVLAAIATETPPPVGDLNPDVPPRLAALIDRLLAKDPAGRPPSAQAVFDELHEIDKGLKGRPAADRGRPQGPD